METTYRVIAERDLLRFLEGYHRLIALEFYGVNNWDGYYDAICEHRVDLAASYNFDPDDDWDYIDFAKSDLEKYPSISVDLNNYKDSD